MAAYRRGTKDLDWKQGRVSPLHRLDIAVAEIAGQIALHNIERHRPVVVEPWWSPPQIYIANIAEDATKDHNKVKRNATDKDIIIYTDGSDINRHVGSAAVQSLPNGRWKYKMAHMGTSEQCIVYAVELAGILQALEFGTTQARHINTVTIFTDNQAAIQSTRRPGSQSGQWLLRMIVQRIKTLAGFGIRTAIRWIPAHTGVPGNELADECAKKASESQTARKPYCWTPRTVQLQASYKRKAKAYAADTWKKEWYEAPHGIEYRSWFRNTEGGALNKKVDRLYAGLPKAMAAILIQLRSGKIALNSYLHKIKKIESPTCTCKLGRQTVTYVIEECPLFR
jgi:ribonuclease HI